MQYHKNFRTLDIVKFTVRNSNFIACISIQESGMRQTLDTILKLLQQSNHMTAEDRVAAEKALKQAEEELQKKN